MTDPSAAPPPMPLCSAALPSTSWNTTPTGARYRRPAARATAALARHGLIATTTSGRARSPNAVSPLRNDAS